MLRKNISMGKESIRLPLVLSLFLLLLLPVWAFYIFVSDVPDYLDRLHEYLKKKGGGRVDW